MAYTKTFLLNLGPAKTGLTLKAQIVDTTGTNVGVSIASGFVELGSGFYLWTGNIPDNQQGAVIFMDTAGTSSSSSGVGIVFTDIETVIPINLGDQVLFDHITASIVDTLPTSVSFKGDTSILSSVNNMYNNMVLVFISGNLKGVSNRIVGYTGSTGLLSFNTPFAIAPANGDRFIIIGRIS